MKSRKKSIKQLSELEKSLTEKLAAVKAELKKRGVDEFITQIKNLSIGEITTKDFVVHYYLTDNPDPKSEEDYYNYSFYLLRNGKEYCIYYGVFDDHDDIVNIDSWWPYDGENNAADHFVPSKFCEECENSYSFEGTLEEAIKYLKACGFTKIKEMEC